MPAVAYYLGRPVRFWTAAMSGPAQTPVANPAAVTCQELATPATADSSWSAKTRPRRHALLAEAFPAEASTDCA